MFAACTDVRKLQVLQSKSLRLATCAPGTLVAGRIANIWVFHSLLTHIRALTASFD